METKHTHGPLPDIIGGECRHCGRQYNDDDDTQLTYCPADDCPGHISRTAIAKAEGRE